MTLGLSSTSGSPESSEFISTNSGDFVAFPFADPVGLTFLTGSSFSSSESSESVSTWETLMVF